MDILNYMDIFSLKTISKYNWLKKFCQTQKHTIFLLSFKKKSILNTKIETFIKYYLIKLPKNLRPEVKLYFSLDDIYIYMTFPVTTS